MSLRMLTLVVVFGAAPPSIYAQHQTDDRPSHGELIDSIPLLSHDSEELESFALTAIMPEMFDRLVIKVAWRRGEIAGMLGATGPQEVPCWFVSDAKGFLFDASAAALTVWEDVGPRVILSATAEGIAFNYGFRDVKNTEIRIDLASFLKSGTNHTVTASAGEGWELTANSKSGKSEMKATFGKSKPFVLKTFNIRSVEGNQTLFEFTDLHFKSDQQIDWPAFPREIEFPGALELNAFSIKDAGSKQEAIHDYVQFGKHLMRVISCQAAISDPKKRAELSRALDIDWDKVVETYNTAGVELRKLVDPTKSENDANAAKSN